MLLCPDPSCHPFCTQSRPKCTRHALDPQAMEALVDQSLATHISNGYMDASHTTQEVTTLLSTMKDELHSIAGGWWPDSSISIDRKDRSTTILIGEGTGSPFHVDRTLPLNLGMEIIKDGSNNDPTAAIAHWCVINPLYLPEVVIVLQRLFPRYGGCHNCFCSCKGCLVVRGALLGAA